MHSENNTIVNTNIKVIKKAQCTPVIRTSSKLVKIHLTLPTSVLQTLLKYLEQIILKLLKPKNIQKVN